MADMTAIGADLLAQLPLSGIDAVTFYKRDELMSDLICCDVYVGQRVWTFHEEIVGWDDLLNHLYRSPRSRLTLRWLTSVSTGLPYMTH
jgi:hypothetical protein